MGRKILLTCWALLIGFATIGQMKKQFTVEESPGCESIRLRLKANSGNCFIKPTQEPQILNVFSNQQENAYAHNFRKEIKGKVCEVLLNVEESNSEGIGQTISTRFFGTTSNNSSDKIWKMYLTEAKPYALELNYGIGKAHVDLSGLAIKNLRIITASADVVAGYSSALGNQLEMDTFAIKVDVGSILVNNLNLSKTRNVVADVGFGSMTLDFSGKPEIFSRIKGSIGAGNLTILLPSADVPVIVKVKDSWLCSLKMPASLKRIGENTFANAAYSKDVKNALYFDLDVSLGNIVFKDPAR